MSFYTLGIGTGRQLPIVLQAEESECGLACLAMIAVHHGHRMRLADLRQRFPVSRKGATLASLIKIAAALKLDSRPLRLELDNLPELQLPCVIHWDMNHFVVLKSAGRRRIVIPDPAVGIRSVNRAEFGKHFTGVALELSPANDFAAEDRRTPLSIGRLMGRISGLRRGLAHVLVLALGLEVCAIAMPFYLQWVVDHALASGDRDLISVLAIGFGLLVLLQAAIGALRGWLVASLSVHFDFQWLGNVFAHLLRLPLDYFEKRHVGAITSYFTSINTIQETLTIAFVQAVVDGLLVVGTLMVMLLYSPALTAVGGVSVILYGVLRWITFAALRNATAEEILGQAKQSTHFLETLRGVQSVRLFGRAQERRVGWMNMLADKFNAHLRVQKITVTQQTANALLLGIERVIVIWLGALAVLRNEFTAGMLFAFLAYREQFSTRIAALIDKLFELRMLGLHAERVADVVQARPEQEDPEDEREGALADTSIELRQVSYRYSLHEDEILSDIDLRIESGECVAIIGPSGCGKTTLAKILLGLFEPASGEVLVGGRPLRRFGLANYRRLVGTVMQDDMLFSGSIADNISFFDPNPDQAMIERCARQAAIDDEILSMQMGYNSLVGDIGAGLSGGQKQRILLARALYKRPRILVLDEATSHLDVDNERMVNEAVQSMNLTRIVIAHRPETIAMANRVIVLAGGRVERDFSVAGTAGNVDRIAARSEE